MVNTYLIGKSAEELAAEYLKEKGLEILDRNFRTRFGEIDIVARDDKRLVIVEVKAKSTSDYGKPYEMVTKRKKKKIITTGKSYLMDKGFDIGRTNWRIDVVSVDYDSGEIEWIKNAITEDEIG